MVDGDGDADGDVDVDADADQDPTEQEADQEGQVRVCRSDCTVKTAIFVTGALVHRRSIRSLMRFTESTGLCERVCVTDVRWLAECN